MNRVFSRISIIKSRYQDNAFIILVRFLYRVFSNSTFLVLCNVLLPIFFSFPIIKDTNKYFKYGIICLIIIILINILCAVAKNYKLYSQKLTKGHSIIVSDFETIYKTFNERVSNKDFDYLFQSISDTVCTDVYYYFREVFGFETRVSLIQQYEKNGKFYSVTVSRRSKKTQLLGKRKGESKVKYNVNNGKYYNKIILDNKDDTVVLDAEEIKEYFNYSNKQKKHAMVNQYICMPQKAYGSRIAFLLQIDIMDKNVISKKKKEAEEYCDEYMQPYMRILQNAYLIQLIHK